MQCVVIVLVVKVLVDDRYDMLGAILDIFLNILEQLKPDWYFAHH